MPHLTHVALWSADVERSIAFYRKYCDLSVVHRRQEPGGAPVIWLGEREGAEFVIVLIQRRAEHGDPASFAHFGFSCEDRGDVDRRAEMARVDGILDLPAADGGPVVGYYCIVRDPDGNPVEFSHGQSIGRR